MNLSLPLLQIPLPLTLRIRKDFIRQTTFHLIITHRPALDPTKSFTFTTQAELDKIIEEHVL